MRKMSVPGIILPTNLAIAAPAENQVVGVTYTDVLNIWGLYQRKCLLILY